MSNELPPLPAHFAYCYEWVTQTGGARRSFSCALYNGVGATTSFPLYTESHLREYGRACERAAYERARHIVRTYKVPVGNSAAGEMACEWTMDALKEIDDAISALGADK